MSLPTIRDVAKAAGVSIATVSCVINKSKPVSEPLQERVRQAMMELGYRPNPVARGLRGKGTNTVGLLVPDITIPVFPEILRGVEFEARKNGYNVILCDTNEDLEQEEAALGMLKEKFVDGVIISGVRGKREGNGHIARFLDEGIPTVLIDRPIEGVRISCVTIDNRLAAKQIVLHLIGHGHRRIGFIAGPLDISVNEERLKGCKDALEENGMELDLSLLQEGNYKIDGGFECADNLLRMPNPPTAIFAFNDLMAIGAMSAAKARGLRIPSDISIAGFDDISVSGVVEPPLTTVRQPLEESDVMFAIDSFFTVYDTRHSSNNPIFVLASWNYFRWTGDVEFLRSMIKRMRQALRYQQTVMGGLKYNHIRNPWVGHDGLPGWKVNPDGSKTIYSGHGIGNNSWDLLPFGGDDMYATAQYYAATLAMAEVEEMIASHPRVERTRGCAGL